MKTKSFEDFPTKQKRFYSMSSLHGNDRLSHPPILLDEPQIFKGVLIFVQHVCHCNIFHSTSYCLFLSKLVHFKHYQCHFCHVKHYYILTKHEKKSYYGTYFLNTLYKDFQTMRAFKVLNCTNGLYQGPIGNNGITSGTNGMPMVQLVISLVPMVSLVSPTVFSKVPLVTMVLPVVPMVC